MLPKVWDFFVFLRVKILVIAKCVFYCGRHNVDKAKLTRVILECRLGHYLNILEFSKTYTRKRSFSFVADIPRVLRDYYNYLG